MVMLFYIICGIVTTSVLCPIIYSILYKNKGFPSSDAEKTKRLFDSWIFWGIMFGGFCILTGLILGFNLGFKIGCIIGLASSFLGWIVFLFFTSRGAAVRIYLDVNILKKQLKQMKKNDFPKYEIEKLKQDIDSAEKRANELIVEKSKNRINKILDKM